MEIEVHTIKGAMDWMKVAFAIMGSAMIGGFALFGTQLNTLRAEMTAGFATIRTEMREDRAAANAAVAAQVNPNFLLREHIST